MLAATPQFAAYPPDMSAVQQLGSQVQQAMHEQAQVVEAVHREADVRNQHTYEQLVLLHRQQQEQAKKQLELNNHLLAELEQQRDLQRALMAQLADQSTIAKAHERGLHDAAASSVRTAEALEEMRRRTSARWHAFTAAPRVPAHAPGAAESGVQMVYGFQEVPKAPTFSGSTKVQKRKFMDQYEAYRREISLANAQRPGGAQIHQVPLSACIDPLSVERIAFWEIGKASHELVEGDWRTYFWGARECDPVDIHKLDAAMSKLKMETGVKSAESRVSKLVSDFDAILVRLSMEGFAEHEGKLTVDYLVAAIQPPVVQKRVKELLRLSEFRNVRKDARMFKDWLADYMRRYGEFEPLREKTAASKASVKKNE